MNLYFVLLDSVTITIMVVLFMWFTQANVVSRSSGKLTVFTLLWYVVSVGLLVNVSIDLGLSLGVLVGETKRAAYPFSSLGLIMTVIGYGRWRDVEYHRELIHLCICAYLPVIIHRVHLSVHTTCATAIIHVLVLQRLSM